MSWLMAEYQCRSCGDRFDSLESRSAVPPILPHSPCNAMADRVISAPKIKTSYASVTRGKSDGPPNPYAMDTRALAEGMPRREWLAKRRKLHGDRRKAQIRNMVS